jgi:hypothetical protein
MIGVFYLALTKNQLRERFGEFLMQPAKRQRIA